MVASMIGSSCFAVLMFFFMLAVCVMVSLRWSVILRNSVVYPFLSAVCSACSVSSVSWISPSVSSTIRCVWMLLVWVMAWCCLIACLMLSAGLVFPFGM